MKRRNRNLQMSKTGKIALGVLYSLAVMLIISIIVSTLLLTGENPISATGISSIIVIVTSAIISGVTLIRVFGNSDIGAPVLSFLLSALVILITGLIRAGQINFKLLLNIFIYILTGIISAYIARPRENRRKFR